jgi:hypothetical protein
MKRVRRKTTKNQPRRDIRAEQEAIPLDDETVTTPPALAVFVAEKADRMLI